MWTIGQLKWNARQNLSRSYWKSVLAALVLGLGINGAGRIYAIVSGLFFGAGTPGFDFMYSHGGAFQGFSESWHYGMGPYAWKFLSALPFLGLAAGIAIGVALVLRIAISLFLCGPLEVGSQRWFIVNRARMHAQPDRYAPDATASCTEIVQPFSRGYLNVVKGIFLRWLYLTLWSLLFVIPGIVKAYSYRLVPYILAESPEMDTREAFRLSRAMMDGNKAHAFGLDLSFLLWDLLSLCTFGIVGFFYVAPYRAQTNLELYVTLRDQYLGSGAARQA